MGRYLKKPVKVEAITFDELVEFGLKQPGANIVGGMPWSFEYQGHHVTHERDDCYLIQTTFGTMRMNRGNMLVIEENGEVYPLAHDDFEATYVDLIDAFGPAPSIEQLLAVAKGDLMAFLKSNTNARTDHKIGDKTIFVSRHGVDLSKIVLNLSQAEASARKAHGK